MVSHIFGSMGWAAFAALCGAAGLLWSCVGCPHGTTVQMQEIWTPHGVHVRPVSVCRR